MMATSTPLYASLMTQFERRRERLGWTFETVEACAGIGEGMYAKLLHVDASSGRRGNWPLIQIVADALFTPGAHELRIIDHGAKMLASASRSVKNTTIPKNMRVVLAGMASEGGRARAAKLSAQRRSEIARSAAEARWRTARATPAWTGGPRGYLEAYSPRKTGQRAALADSEQK
jgi:hypothetical protein